MKIVGRVKNYMRFKLLSILVLMLGYSYPLEAKNLGESLYSSKLYSNKFKKDRIPLERKNGTDTATLKKGTYTSKGNLGSVTPTFRPWLGQSLYKKDKEDKPQSYYLPKTEKKDEYYYYSNIFYKERRRHPDEKVEEVNPFLRK